MGYPRHGNEAFISTVVSEMKNSPDSEIAKDAETYLELQKDAADGTDAKAKLAERCLIHCMYRSAARLSKGGSKVHLLYWDRTPLIEKLGSGSVDAAAVLLGNEDASMMYGNVMNEDLSEILQKLLWKFMNREDLELYRNEIEGVDELNWEPFPKALTVSNETLQCGTIPSRKDQWMRA